MRIVRVSPARACLRVHALACVERHADRLLQIVDRAQKAVGRRGLGIDQAMQAEAVLHCEQDGDHPCRIRKVPATVL